MSTIKQGFTLGHFVLKCLQEDFGHEKSIYHRRRTEKCRKVMEAFEEMYEEQEVVVADAGNYGFVKLQWLNECGFDTAVVFSDSEKLFESLWETWFEYHVFTPVLGTPLAELDYEEIFQTFPKDKQDEIMKKKAYFRSLCEDGQ